MNLKNGHWMRNLTLKHLSNGLYLLQMDLQDMTEKLGWFFTF
jgi:hypothetical protein